MRVSGERCVLVHTEHHPLPDTANLPTALYETIQNLKNDRRLGKKHVLISIARTDALLRCIQLPNPIPKADADTQNAAIATVLETETYIPVPLHSVGYDFHLMTDTALLVGWMRSGILDTLAGQLNESRIKRVHLTPQPVLLANQLLKECDSSERVCGIHLDGNNCEVVIIEAGVVCLARSVLIETPDQLIPTIQQTLGTVPKTDTPSIQRIILYSAQPPVGAKSPCPSGFLRPTELPRALGLFDCEVTEAPFDWAKALLMPQLTDEGIELNLLTPILAKRAAQQQLNRKHQIKQWIPRAAILLLLLTNIMLFRSVETNKALLDTENRKEAQKKTLTVKNESLKTQYDTLNDALTQLSYETRQFPPLSKRFSTIAEQIPATVQLTEIQTLPLPRATKAYATFDARSTLRLIGTAENQTDIDAFRVALITQPEFSTVKQIQTEQITISGQKRLEFTLELTAHPIKGETP